jgi:hypothetical protein
MLHLLCKIALVLFFTEIKILMKLIKNTLIFYNIFHFHKEIFKNS